MSELLFEIGCEEIPADALPAAIAGMTRIATEKLTAGHITFAGLEVWSTPRRLVLVVPEMSDMQSIAQEQIMGPAWRIAFDAEGKPTKAAEGFAAKQGVSVKALSKVVTDKGEYVGVERKVKAQKTAKILPGILDELLRAVPFPKSMRWGSHEESFVRPVHWIVALMDGKTLPVKFAGIKSGNKTFGHRFMAPKAIPVANIADYVAKLNDAKVMVRQSDRRQSILQQVEAAATARGGKVILDEKLISEVTFLVEWPVALTGQIEERFLEIPREVIVTSMRDHQRYFSVEGPDGKLLPYFITISNMVVPDPEVVLAGNRRVLAARLSDAVFFVREDLKVPLIDRLEALKGIVFQVKLGTVYDKYERFSKLAAAFNAIVKKADAEKLNRAAALAKADLTTGMVGEFPELQGMIGAELARRQNEDPSVVQAIFEHYLPRGADDQLPKGDLGALVGMADKLDTVVGCFGVGLIPTGSADPYALRRAALGIINILWEHKYPLFLDTMIDASLNLLQPKITRPHEDVRKDVLHFFRGRFENLLLSRGMAADEVDAVLARGFADAVDASARIDALHRFRKDPAFDALAAAFKRASNILAKELGAAAPVALNPGLFDSEAEKDLHRRLEELSGQVTAHFQSRRYEDALRAVSALREPVDRFFNEVLVVSPDAAVKANRLALLAGMRSLFDSFADFTKLGG